LYQPTLRNRANI